MIDALYNEIDPYPAAWLRNLIAADHIPPGHVDERSIADLTANDVSDRAQVHFFAGIGGWNHALELAEWPAARPVWTGSCPCQPFSQAGKQKGASDERHLWPEMRRLIAECQPPVVFGEQVASKLGRDWLAGVRADLEDLGYAVGSADLCAAGIGAPHIRQRLYWGAIRLADANQRERGRVANGQGRQHDGQTTGRQQGDGFAQPSGASGWLANTDHSRPQGWRERRDGARQWAAGPGGLASWLADSDSTRRSAGREASAPAGHGCPAGAEGWASADWLECLDGKTRRIPAEPAFFPLADGVPGRVGRLRAYGNAIVPQVAAQFVTAFMEAQHD